MAGRAPADGNQEEEENRRAGDWPDDSNVISGGDFSRGAQALDHSAERSHYTFVALSE
ncbi:MAG: hypothetical protein ACRENK_13035 [Gemmatimonadaceae bacterium]